MSEPTPKVPLSERIVPMAPIMPDGKARSKIYSLKKLRNDYMLFMEEQPNFDANKSVEQMQRELFSLLENDDPIQAWEWVLAKNWKEWDVKDKETVWKNLTPEQKSKLGPISRIFSQ